MANNYFHIQGFLLYGPPGTGKTLLVKALASEANMPLFAVKPSSIMNKYIGVSAKNVNFLFRLVSLVNMEYHNNMYSLVEHANKEYAFSF